MRPGWDLLRRVAAADASVGRILDGHQNAVERLEVAAEPEVARARAGRGRRRASGCSASGAPTRARARATRPACTRPAPASSCAAPRPSARAPAASTRRWSWSAATTASRRRWSWSSAASEVEVDRSWYRAAGLRASESHRVVFHDAPVTAVLGEPGELARDPWFSRDAMRTAASWAGMVDAAVDAALDELAARRAEEPLAQLAAGRIEAAHGTVDAWLDRAAAVADASRRRPPTPRRRDGEQASDAEPRATGIAMRAEIDRAAKAILEVAAAACGSHPFVTGGRLDRARRDLETFLLQHRLDPLLTAARRREAGAPMSRPRPTARPRPGRALRAARPRIRRPLGLRDQRVRAAQVPDARSTTCRRAPAARWSSAARSASSPRCWRRAATSLRRRRLQPDRAGAGARAARPTTPQVELLRAAPPGGDAGRPLRHDRLRRDPLLLERRAGRATACARIEAALAPGGTLLAVHWRHPDPRRELTGDDVHAILDEAHLARPRRQPHHARLPARPLAGAGERRGGADRDRRRRPGGAGGGGAPTARRAAPGTVTILAREDDAALRTAAADQGLPARRVGPRGAAARRAAAGTRSAGSSCGPGSRWRSSTSAPARSATAGRRELRLRPRPAGDRRRAARAADPGRRRRRPCRRCAGSATPSASPSSARGDRALVVGSGFIGCEAAASLAMRGVEVTMATLEAAPQVERLGEEVAARDRRLARRARRRRPRRSRAASRSARPATAPPAPASPTATRSSPTAILLALGVERNDGLAAAAGIAVEDGIQVDAAMATADPRVLAAGDVAFAFNAAAGRRLRVEHWGEALNMGEVAGSTMAGVEAGWDVAPGFWSTIGEHTIKYVGWGDGWDELRFEPRRRRRLRLPVRPRRRAGRGRHPRRRRRLRTRPRADRGTGAVELSAARPRRRRWRACRRPARRCARWSSSPPTTRRRGSAAASRRSPARSRWRRRTSR